MKKNVYLLSSALIAASSGAFAQDASPNIYQDILVTEEMKLQDKMSEASDSARKLLEQKPQQIKLDIPAEIEPVKLRKPNPLEIKKAATENLSAAPFGLLWGGTIADIQGLGINLTSIEVKDYVNTFSATNLPKSINGFRAVDIIFGEENELWRIIAYGDLLNDDATASKAMAEYRKYYALLDKKYGNANEYYIPQVGNPDTNNSRSNAPAFVPSTDAPNPGNAPDLLSKIQSGQTVLYATFQDKDTGAALAVSVDGNGQSYITIDYKSLRILRQRETQTLEAL